MLSFATLVTLVVLPPLKRIATNGSDEPDE
jgi:hypothetical protein